MHASVVAHPNIALVKYWGKRDSRLNLPAAGSLSLTLGPVATRTSLTFGAEEDSLELNGVAVPAAKRLRVATLLDGGEIMNGKWRHAAGPGGWFAQSLSRKPGRETPRSGLDGERP